MRLHESKERILSAAEVLFHKNGYCGVGVAEICAQANVIKGSFYHFFPSKADLVQSVLDRNWNSLENFLDTLNQTDAPAREKLCVFFKGIVDGAKQMQDIYGQILGCNLGTMASELATTSNQSKLNATKIMANWKRRFVALVREGQKDGSIDPNLDPMATATTLLALAQGMSVLGRTFDDVDSLKQIANQAMLLTPAPKPVNEVIQHH